MNILEQPWVIVDIETNGLSYSRGRVIEIAVIRIEGGEITDEFQTLINPETPLSPFVKELTGISSEDLRKAPTFESIDEKLEKLFENAIFMAHSVRFDYAFVKNEFSRVGKRFTPKLLCSVRLSKFLNPQHRSHSLDKIIKRYDLPVLNRHRAYDDALAVWQFIGAQRRLHGDEAVAAALASQLRLQSLPPQLDEKVITRLPESAGVYIFEDEQGSPLYIGKSVNIRKRVLSHFAQDHAVEKELKLSQLVKNVTAYSTASELEALLLESQLVKERYPIYNQRLRRTRQLTLALRSTNESGYMTVKFAEAKEIDPEQISNILGVYSSRSQAKQYLMNAQKVFDLCPKLLGLENSKSRCFLSQLSRCKGACIENEAAEFYNRRLLIAFETMRIHEWPFQTPILINEKAADSDHASGIVVDRWCIVAHLTQEGSEQPVAQTIKRRFDMDIYRILRAFVANRSNRTKIVNLNTIQLKNLLDQAA